ncbi:MAG: glycoside hydrolase family 88 protein [Spirosomaceae bacterium]|nr:glycoside hydrolase family 88 protein [Spirosomataceae bacterium]
MKYLPRVIVIALVFALLLSCKTTKPATKNRNMDVAQAMLSALAWQEANPIFSRAPTDWTNGAYYTCVMKAHQATKAQPYYDAMLNMGRKNAWKTYERLFHADDVVISNAYLYLKQLGEKEVDLAPTEKFIQVHLYEPQDWKVGKGNKEQVILWWWCDALFMTPPIITRYSVYKNDPKYLDEMHKYYMECYNLLFDKEENLFYRDNRFLWKGTEADRKEPNGKKVFWSRGNGWVLAGLAMMLEDMPKNYKHRPFYEDLYKKMAKKVLDLQPADGLWRVSLLNPESFPHGEVSGSGFFTYAFAWGVNNGYLDAKLYKPAVLKAWNSMKECQQESGKVGWVQNIGYDPKPADKDSWQNFGTGAFLLAGSEIIKMK